MALEQISGLNKMSYMRRLDSLDIKSNFDYVKLSTINFLSPFILMAPPFKNPAENFPKILNNCDLKMETEHGTTTLGFKFQGGVILCADSRATAGKYIGSQDIKKIVELNNYMLGTLAGGASDCVYWDRVLTRECRLHELRYHKRIPVDSAARVMCNIANEYKGMGLAMGMMLAGCDHDGPKLIYVDSEGQRVYGNLFSVGSGSNHALGILDSKYRWEMTDKEAYDLACRSLYHATHTDAYSGGNVRLYHITAKGWNLISNTDCMELHEKYTFII